MMNIKTGQVSKCFYCEITENNRKIILANGKWYEIATNFVAEIENYYKNAISRSDGLSLLNCDEKCHEDKYNLKLSESIENGVLMDRKNIRYGGGASSVEFCDVYDSENNTFIHIKNYYGSSALSHLFAQGRVFCTTI